MFYQLLSYVSSQPLSIDNKIPAEIAPTKVEQ
jgi:hypothetical protein